MKVSLNWIKQYLDFELPPVDEIVERIGSQLGAVEDTENLGAKYKGVLVAKVVSCKKHEGSDHLNVCLIDDGGAAKDVARDENGYVQVVCGAPNVREGLTVAWLPPGSTVPESIGKDPFVLEARELRGVVSNGMLASPKELALSDNHEGILEIDKDVAPGSPFAPVYKLDDYVIDIENKMFTHRPDCFGALGVAREIAGILGHKFTSPDWYQPNPSFSTKSADLPVTVTNELPELAPRFSTITLSNVTVTPSPVWLQVALAKVGQKSINNIVDLTNLYMLLTAQPLHAYDYDKVKALTSGISAEITIRYARKGEKIALLNGKTIEPRAEAIMIASGDHLIGLAGVMGGSETEVSHETKNIILEAANFDMYSVRRSSMTHGLFTDAVTRFNKGQSPLQTLAVLAKITDDIQKMAGGEIASDLVDVSQVTNRQWVHPPVPVTVDFINTRLGFKLSAAEMKTLLENVEFEISSDSDNLTVTAPFWRTDIETREDIVEEIGRLYGFDKLPLELPQRSIKPAKKDELLELKTNIRTTLAKAGANEVLTYSFVHENLLSKVDQDKSHAFQLSNALSPDLQYYRLSLTPSLLDKIHANVKAGYDTFALFEIGKGHNKGHVEDELPKEVEKTAFVIADASKTAQSSGAAYYQAKKYLDQLGNKLGLDLRYEPLTEEPDYQTAKPFDFKRSAHVKDANSDLVVGIIGEFKRSVSRGLKLPGSCAGFEISTAKLLTQNTKKTYTALPRFPKIIQDITLKVPAELPYQDLYYFVCSELVKAQPEQTLPLLSPIDIYQKQDDQVHKQVTFRLTIASYERTMTDAEVSKLLDTIASAAKTKFGAEKI